MSVETYNIPGVWPDGLLNTYATYQTMFSPVFLGTHVANDPMIVYATYSYANSYYVFADWTYNKSMCGYSATASYLLAYNVTYAATYYQRTYCNIRSFAWI